MKKPDIEITQVRVAESDADDDGVRFVAVVTDTRDREIGRTATEALRRVFDHSGWAGRAVVFVDSRGERLNCGAVEEFAALCL